MVVRLGGPAHDALIAFTAAEHNATLLSLDRAGLITAIVVAHSSRLSRLDPREAQMFRLQVGMADTTSRTSGVMTLWATS